MKSLRFGILGTGNIAGQFCNGVRASSRVSIAAVGSRSAESAKNFADRFACPISYGSYDSLLADPKVDAIYLSLPNSMHHEWTIKALRAGKHVLCEKPLATDRAQGEEMFDVAQKSGRLLVEAFMYVSHPQTTAVLHAVNSGVIGKLSLIRTSFCYRTNRIDGNIRFDAKLAGGALMDVGCYCINFARLIANSEPIKISASAMMHPSGVDQLTAAVLEFPNGVISTFSCGMTTQCDNTAHVCGSEGYLEIPWPWKPSKSVKHTLAHSVPPKQDKNLSNAPPRQEITIEAPGELYQLEAEDFAAAVLDGAKPKVSRANSLGNLAVLDEIRRQIGLRF